MNVFLCSLLVVASLGMVYGAEMTLAWTAPGDDGSIGIASVYDIRYSQNLITEENWNEATQLTGEPVPRTAGTTEEFVVYQRGYYAIKTADEVPNWSLLSNVIYIGGTCNIADFILTTKCLLGK